MNVLAGVSVVMCAAVCILWVRSYSGSDAVRYTRMIQAGYPHHLRMLVFVSGAGATQVGWGLEYYYARPQSPPPAMWEYLCEDEPVHFHNIQSNWKYSFAGFGKV